VSVRYRARRRAAAHQIISATRSAQNGLATNALLGLFCITQNAFRSFRDRQCCPRYPLPFLAFKLRSASHLQHL